MDKVGIITCGKEPNYGACLQAFSTYKFIQELGYDTEILNYSFMDENVYSPLKQKTIKSFIASLVYYTFRKAQMKAFERFRNNNIRYSTEQLNTVSDFQFAKNNYDILVVGSDQVWNPELGIDTDITLINYYQKGQGPKKISYGSSFGISELPTAFKIKYKNGLSDFDNLSVREDSGKVIIEDLIKGRTCKVVVDPVMLFSKREWSKYEDSAKTPQEDYILIYDLRHSTDLQKFAIRLSQKTKTKVIAISSLKLRNKNILTIEGVSPAHFLSLFRNAKAIVTDSFHGTVFSLIYQKDFYTFIPSEKAKKISSRIYNLLEPISLSNRIYSGNQFNIEQKEIDYDTVNELLCLKIEESKEYLRSALKNAECRR